MSAPVTGETITDDQIRELRKECSNHAVTVTCKRALTVNALRLACEAACRAVALADPLGMKIEHLNHRLTESGFDLGRALIARDQCADAWNARSTP